MACIKRYNTLHVKSISAKSLGVKKKLQKLGKTKDCELVQERTGSIVNHLYRSVSSSVDGNPDEMEEKWASINNHLHNVHRSHGKIFKNAFIEE